jgi:hypothetical protein
MRAHSSLLLPHLRRLRQWEHLQGIQTGLRQRTPATWTLWTTSSQRSMTWSPAPAGQRDWDRFRALFLPDGRIVSLVPESAATKDRPARKGDAIFLTPDMFAQQNDSYFKTNGFFERSIANRVEEFGNLIEVWSTSEIRDAKDDVQPSSRGIDSFQIVHAHGRFWIASLLFDHERPGVTLPAKYLKKAGL